LRHGRRPGHPASFIAAVVRRSGRAQHLFVIVPAVEHRRLNALLGSLRAFSYGSLYPCLKSLLRAGLIAQEAPAGSATPFETVLAADVERAALLHAR